VILLQEAPSQSLHILKIKQKDQSVLNTEICFVSGLKNKKINKQS
jgi:hypothetical protein